MEEDYLIHYGVLGMKWGVRKDRSSSTGRSKKSSSAEQYYRVGKAGKDINKSGALYVSSTKDDASRYVKNLGPSLLGRVLGVAHTHVHTLSSSKKLKHASEDETIKGTLNFFKKDKKALEVFNKSLERYHVGEKEVTSAHIEKALKDPKSKDAKKLAYAFSAILGNEEFSKHASRLYDQFRSKGYDAIPDLFDRNVGVSKTPTIVIRPEKVKLVSSIKIDKNVYKKAKKYVKKLGKIPASDIVDYEFKF